VVALSNSLEGGTNGTTMTQATGGNTGGASGNFFDSIVVGTGTSVKFSSAFAAHGSLSAAVTVGTTAASAFFSWTTSLGTVTTLYGRAYINLSAAPPSNNVIVEFENASSHAADFTLSTSRTIIIRNAAFGTTHTMTTALTTGTWYRLEWEVVASTTVGQITLNIYVGDATTPTESYTSPATLVLLAALNQVVWGWPGGTIASMPVTYWDDLALSTTGFIGPVTTAISDTDTGAGTDTATVAAGVSDADTATGTDTASVTVPVSVSDTAAGTDTATIGASVAGSDTGTGTDTATVHVAVTDTDTGAGTDTATVGTSVAGSDSGAGTDTASMGASVASSDTASGTDFGSQVGGNTQVSGADTGAGTDTGSVTSATGAFSDTASGTDTATIHAAVSGSDAASGADTATVTVPVSGSDTGAGTDTAAVSAGVSGSDSAVGTDTASVHVALSGSDTAAGIDNASVVTPGTGGKGLLLATFP
jgi:hypothetical protein